MNLQLRKELLVRLGKYMAGNEPAWEAAKRRAFSENQWFIPEFINLAVVNIVEQFLSPEKLQHLTDAYQVPEVNPSPKKVGIVMAGNIPMVGFHDLMCVFISGHKARIKLSSKDEVLIRHLVDKMTEWNDEINDLARISDMVKNCDAYIATGSNNSSRYFEFYFQKYPHIIRRNRTSVAILTGKESQEELEKLADDVYLFFGLGCRNVTKIHVPEGYDFIPLLEAFRKYNYLADNNKFKNNYDYNLAMLILNKSYYMTNGSILLVENPSPFSRIGLVHYEFYQDQEKLRHEIRKSQDIQCLVSPEDTGFGHSQVPAICDFADGVDTMAFLMDL